MPDNPFSVDHEGHPTREQSKCFWDLIKLSDPSPVITQESEWKPVFLRKPFVTLCRIGADPDHLGPLLLKQLILVSKGTGLFCAARRFILGIKKEDDILPSLEIRETNLLPIGRWEFKLRRPLSHWDHPIPFRRSVNTNPSLSTVSPWRIRIAFLKIGPAWANV